MNSVLSQKFAFLTNLSNSNDFINISFLLETENLIFLYCLTFLFLKERKKKFFQEDEFQKIFNLSVLFENLEKKRRPPKLENFSSLIFSINFQCLLGPKGFFL